MTIDVMNLGQVVDVLSGVQGQGSDRLLVVGQGGSGLPCDQVPQTDGRVMAACRRHAEEMKKS